MPKVYPIVGQLTICKTFLVICATLNLVMEILILFSYLLIGGLIVFWGLPAVITSFYGAPWLPTPKATIYAMFKLAQPTKNEVLYDLGSGYGRIVIEASRLNLKKAVGIEIGPIKVILSRVHSFVLGKGSQTTFIRGNLFHESLKDADVIICFLMQPTNKRLMAKFAKELKVGTRIVSHRFTFPGWKIVKSDTKHDIYMYVVGTSF